MTTLSIEFGQCQAIFRPGEGVRGTATIQLEKELKARAVKIVIDGRATTKWEVAEKSTDSHNRSALVPYSSCVEYIHTEDVVWKSDERKNLSIGKHSFDFCFILPDDCPPSFEAHHGSIRYHISLVVERPWKVNKVFNAPFSVIPAFDLNACPLVMEEAEVIKTKNIGLVFFRYGRITLKARLSRKGFVAGERIRIKLNVTNDSSRPVLNVEVSLIEVADFVAYRYGCESTRFHGNLHEQKTLCDNNKRTDERKVARVLKDLAILPHEEHSSTVEICVPPCVPSFENCTVIHVKYVLEIKVVAKGTINTTARCICPVTIGTVPIAASQLSRLVAALSHREFEENDRFADMEPSYEPCTYLNGGNSEQIKFQPRYPFRPRLLLDQSKDTVNEDQDSERKDLIATTAL